MGFTGLLAFILAALLAVTVKFVVDGVREKNWKKSILWAVLFCAFVLLLYFGLIGFITSM